MNCDRCGHPVNILEYWDEETHQYFIDHGVCSHCWDVVILPQIPSREFREQLRQLHQTRRSDSCLK